MSPAARQRFRYDVFISYSHRDKDWVREWLVPQLHNAGLKVCIDHRDFEPGAPSIMEMERAALQSRKTVLVLTPAYLQSAWTEFENILVQTLDPAAHHRRLLPLLLMHCDIPPRLGILTYVDFTRHDEQADKVVQLTNAIRRRPTGRRKPQATTHTPLPFIVPNGALSPDSSLYIERPHDQVIRQHVVYNGSTTIVEGARQMGKSSLIARAVAHARAQQCTVVVFDFQLIDSTQLESLDSLLRYLADALHERLRLAVTPESIWQGPLSAQDKLSSFIQTSMLQGARTAIVMAMDEVDRVFGHPYQNAFFGLLRAWHNQRAYEPLWGKLNLVLACSTDPRQAITDVHQSPFNVGTKIALGDFSFDDLWELNHRYQQPLQRRDQLQALMDVIAGHPYLAQQALYALATGTHTLPEVLDTTQADHGPFADLLQHYRNLLANTPALRQAMYQVLRNQTCPDDAVFARLRSLGLLAGTSHHDARPRCRLFADYVLRVLS